MTAIRMVLNGVALCALFAALTQAYGPAAGVVGLALAALGGAVFEAGRKAMRRRYARR